jgi:hypothetical protein
VAVAAVAVIAIGALGLAILRPGSGPGVGAQPSPSPSLTVPSPSPAASPTPDPSAPPPLGGTFTSTMHGITLSYPTGWVTDPATEPWTPADGFEYMSPAVDVIHHKVLEAGLFLAVASQGLGGKTGDEWVTDVLNTPDVGCGTTEPITIDGASGRMCDGVAAVSTGGRGYYFRNYTGDDEPWVSLYYDQDWFQSVLDTVQLHPEDALTTTSSGSPAASPT